MKISAGIRSVASAVSAAITISLVIIILPTFYQGPQHILGDQYQDDAGHKSVKGVKPPEIFPLIVSMVVNNMMFGQIKVHPVQNEQTYHASEKDRQQPLYIFGIVKQMFFFFHG
jgi:hypothetical protein